MGSSTNELYNSTFYGYKLYEDATQQDNENIQGHSFTKDKWTTYKTPPPDFLKTCVRTVINPKGKLQYKEFNPTTQEIFFDSNKYLESKPEIFTRDVLSIFKRKALEELSHFYGIDTRNKPDKLLVNLILDAQVEVAKKDVTLLKEPVNTTN
jgi:hypothetical protein